MLQPNDVRLFLRDRPEWNRLLDKEEFTQEMVDQAMKLTVMLYNEMSPMTQFSVENFPYKHLLLIGTCWHLLLGGGIGRDRNRLRHSSGGVAIDDEAHAEVELQLAQSLGAEFKQAAQMIKIEQNIRAGWSHVSSEYMSPGYYKDVWLGGQ